MTLDLKIPAEVKKILDQFEQKDFEIYIVGGIVRDAILGKKLYDWDFTTNATPQEIMDLFPDSFYDNNYGTVGIKRGEERPFEITTYRTDHGYTDSRHPDEVRWGKSLQEDLSRRDFTINALALSPKLEVVDLFGGVDDLQQKLIRAVGNPTQRFSEDALRMMRAVRIAAQLGFVIEPKTLEAIKVNSPLIHKISAERIREELFKIMASDNAADGYLLLKSSGLGAEVLPEMESTFGVEQKSPGRHHIYDVGTHSVESLRNCKSSDPVTRLATLVHDVGKVKTQKIIDGKITFYNHEMVSAKIAGKLAERLRFSNAQKDKLTKLVRWHQFTVDERQTDSALRRFIRNVGVENLEDMLALRVGDRLGGGARETSWRLEEFKRRLVEVQKQPFSVTDLKINGRDVMTIKQVPSGPLVGKYLNLLFKQVENNSIANEREVLLERLRELN